MTKPSSEHGRLAEIAHRLRARGDAINGAVWFAAEASGGYPPVTIGASPAAMAARAACLGPVAPEVATALFAPLEPSGLLRTLRDAWAATTPAAILAARERAVVGWLSGVLDGVPDDLESLLATVERALDGADGAAHPVFAALRARPAPIHALARLQRVGEMIRERRGDSHRNAWSAAGLSPVELCVLTDAWRGQPFGAVTCGAVGWPRAAALAAAETLQARGWLDGDAVTAAGRAARDEIEAATDRGDASLVDALGADADAVIAALEPLARAVVAAGASTAAFRRRAGVTPGAGSGGASTDRST